MSAIHSSSPIYQISLDPLAAGVVGSILLQKVIEIAKERFPTLNRPVLSYSIALVGGCCVVASAYYGSSLALVIHSIALITLQLGRRSSLSSSLPSFLTDMGEQAKKTPFKKYIGTEKSIQALESVLRRTQTTNAILVGPPGVGKTAIIETIVQKIEEDDFPVSSPFYGKKILNLKMRDFLAGGGGLFGSGDTTFRGGLSRRVNDLVSALQKHPNALLFIDEIHLVKARSGNFDSAEEFGELLKDCLDRDKLKIIGATTDIEYDHYIAIDRPFARRFNKVLVAPPASTQCLPMLLAQKEFYEKHYRISISNEAIAAAVVFAVTYMKERALPYAAVDILEGVCSSLDPSKGSVGTEEIAAYGTQLYPQLQPLGFLKQKAAELLESPK